MFRSGGRTILALDKERLGRDNFTSACAWSPKHPNLFDVTYRLYEDGALTDTVRGYFGLRKISVENGVICLNNYPFYQKLLLDQGYWRDSLLTAPTDEAFVSDIQYCKAMGFNGVRKHQKVEDPRFLYHADRLGLLVWGEMANAFEFSGDYVRRFTKEWMEMLERDYNHPCIVAWTPLNESWGVENISTDSRQAHHSCALVELTKSLDATRLVMSNDGWEQTIPDVLGIHDYEPEKEVLSRRYRTVEEVLRFRSAGPGAVRRRVRLRRPAHDEHRVRRHLLPGGGYRRLGLHQRGGDGGLLPPLPPGGLLLPGVAGDPGVLLYPAHRRPAGAERPADLRPPAEV